MGQIFLSKVVTIGSRHMKNELLEYKKNWLVNGKARARKIGVATPLLPWPHSGQTHFDNKLDVSYAKQHTSHFQKRLKTVNINYSHP